MKEARLDDIFLIKSSHYEHGCLNFYAMKCQFCENEANVFYTQVIDGKSKKMNLCDSCAEEQGVTSLEEFKIADVLINDEAPKSSPSEDPTADTSANVGECTNCGFTLDDLRKVGRLGCSHCYEHFGTEVKSMLKSMHRGTQHKGKMPVGMIAAMKEKRDLQKLKTAMDRAIADEKYEEAAKLRDELTALENAPKASKSSKKSSKKKGKTV